MNIQENRVEEGGRIGACVMGARVPRKCNVLLADDEMMVRISIAIVLKRMGLSVDTADDGDAALEKIRQAKENYQLLITDHNMRRMNGLELVKQLKQKGFPGRIMVLSGYLSSQDEDLYRSLNVDKILYKPGDPVELQDAIRNLTD